VIPCLAAMLLMGTMRAGSFPLIYFILDRHCAATNGIRYPFSMVDQLVLAFPRVSSGNNSPTKRIYKLQIHFPYQILHLLHTTNFYTLLYLTLLDPPVAFFTLVSVLFDLHNFLV